MMEINEFAEQVLSAVREKADGDFNVWITTLKMDNGTSFIGITTSTTKGSEQPITYLNGYYNIFIHDQISVREVSDIVYDVIMEHMNYHPDVKITDLMNWKLIKPMICMKLINAERNADLLAHMPHRLFLDFAVVYYIKINETEDELESIDVQNKYLDLWKISEEDLYASGLENMKTSNQILFKNMCEILPPYLRAKDDSNIPMYVLTNKSRYYGASVLLLKDELLKISQSLGNLIILPGSIHQLVILPENSHFNDYKMCAEMVRDVNTSVVLPEDYLSNHVYTYSKDTQELKIAA